MISNDKTLKITFSINQIDEIPYTDECISLDNDEMALFAANIALEAASVCISKFMHAELDNELLFSNNGEAMEKVKKLPQYIRFMELVKKHKEDD